MCSDCKIKLQLLKAPFVKTYQKTCHASMNTYQFIKSQTGSNDLEGCEVRNTDSLIILLFLFLFLFTFSPHLLILIKQNKRPPPKINKYRHMGLCNQMHLKQQKNVPQSIQKNQSPVMFCTQSPVHQMCFRHRKRSK